MKQLLLSLAIALTGVAASAAELSISTGERTGRTYINFTGNIEAGDANRLALFALENPQADWVNFNSPGGLATEGYQIANILSQYHLKAYVNYGAACLSACYSAFLGAWEYDIKGVLGAHVAWSPDEELQEGDSVSAVLARGQALGNYDVYHHIANGFSYELPFYITRLTSASDFLVFTNNDEFLKFYKREDIDNDKLNPYFEFNNEPPKVVKDSEIGSLLFINLDADLPDVLDPRKE